MATKAILLYCDGEQESVAVNQHVYQVVDHYCLVDVRPYLDPKAGKQIDPETNEHQYPYYDRAADAEADVRELCGPNGLVASTNIYLGGGNYRLFRIANKPEQDSWLSNPDNAAVFYGVSMQEAERLAAEQAAAAAKPKSTPRSYRPAAAGQSPQDPPPLVPAGGSSEIEGGRLDTEDEGETEQPGAPTPQESTTERIARALKGGKRRNAEPSVQTTDEELPEPEEE